MATAHRPRSLTATGATLSFARVAIAFSAVTGVVASGAIAAFIISKSRKSRVVKHSSAFASGETDPHNNDQTRSAGPQSMRDGAAHDWDRIDQALDESFPASDPIGVSHID